MWPFALAWPLTRERWLARLGSPQLSTTAKLAMDGDQGKTSEQAADLAAEADLVARAQAGDRAALGVLLKNHGARLYRSVIYPRLGNEAAALDALADTYAKVVTAIHAFVWQNVGFYPWLRVVALRVTLDHLRARKRNLLWTSDDVERELDQNSAHELTDISLIEHQDRSRLKLKLDAALGAIHPRYAEVIRRRVLAEESREALAKDLGISAATLDVLVHRAMTALRKQIGAT
jgi:RNA polymerase sigma factor (sigma-70 family)